MENEKQRERLVELLKETFEYTRGTCIDFDEAAEINADYLLANNVVVLPCVAYNKSKERYQVIHKGKDSRIFASKLYHTRKDGEKALNERSNAN